MSTGKSLLKSTGIISSGNLCSRILGLIRDVVIARVFGVYIYAQAFVIAFKIPNLLRNLVGEGATNAAFIPVFSEYAAKRSKEDFWELAGVLLNLLLVVLAGITLLGVILAPVIVRVIAPGFIQDPLKLETTIRLTRIIFPYIILISLCAYGVAILNSLKHFTVPAFAPCLLNISMIVFVLLFNKGITGLALGVLVGGVLQLLVQLPVLRRKGFRLKISSRFRHPAVNEIKKLMLPRIFSYGIYQINNLVDSIFGSLAWIVGTGGVAVLYFAYRIIQFPIGVFSNALAQAVLPDLSRQAQDEDRQKLKDTLSFSLRSVFLVLLPSSIGLMTLAGPIISGLFQGGRFDAYSTQATASALFFYSVGLWAYGGKKIIHSCFFAMKDTATPARVSFLALLMNVALNLVLMFPLKISGLALATSISGIISFLILLHILNNRLKALDLASMVSSFARILLASLCMGAVCYFFSRRFFVLADTIPQRIINLASLVLLGVASYIVFCFIFKIREMQELWKWLAEKKRA
ncbi:murein biosynthesis integral membrane protein MurJ [Candidatus Omnitrophota bacterium]